jgi:hypothetical protein
MDAMRAALGRLLRRAGFLGFAVLVGGAVGVIANARAEPAPQGTRPAHSAQPAADTAAGAPDALRRASTGR